MPSIRTSAVAVATILAAVARADYVIDPETVPMSLRQTWCFQQQSTCPIICQQYPDQTTEVNSCDPDTLTYGCVCGGGVKPNVTEYTQTLPYFTCTEWGTQCAKACGQDNECARSCREDHPCGAQTPQKPNSTASASATTSSASSTATPSDQVFNGLNGATSTPAPSSTAHIFEAGSSVILAAFVGCVALGAGLF